MGSSDLESATFVIDTFSIGGMEIIDYEGVALDLDNIHELYAKLGLPHLDGIVGGDLLRRHKMIINYKNKKLRLTP